MTDPILKLEETERISQEDDDEAASRRIVAFAVDRIREKFNHQLEELVLVPQLERYTLAGLRNARSALEKDEKSDVAWAGYPAVGPSNFATIFSELMTCLAEQISEEVGCKFRFEDGKPENGITFRDIYFC